uniref:Phosphorylase b kinase regulatory subunit n=1 Tax=Globodera rostochiensis TaxID=31243 RepID=A0A914GR47_GLORO
MPSSNTTKANSLERLRVDVDSIFELVRRLIIDHQSVTTGLFPRYSKGSDFGYARDTIYCSLACWACSLAYKRLDDDRGRETELCQTAVKGMRGVLFCWMQQVEKLNCFKMNNSPEFALHSRFDLQTGAELGNVPFPHLQMDLIALFILILNLVFYIERTYRTPDFGIWERGTRYNRGFPELHSSSLGFVKAALESVNGFNAYGNKGTSDSVIYVDIDGHNRNRTTFETLLPRESNSKNTDASLILTIGWPAFATHDDQKFETTLNKCLRHLEGRFGLRRFLRDGFRTELEDTTRRFYEAEETVQFSGIESQFPMFLACISITAFFKGDNSLADKYWKKFEQLLVRKSSNNSTINEDDDCMLVCPECYCISEEHMKSERETLNSQPFFPIPHAEFGHHLWSNAVLVVGLLLKERLIHFSDIDPIYRHLPAGQRPRNMPVMPSSAFHGRMKGNPVVQIALISESVQLQMVLSTFGITTQTPHEVEPVQIWPSWRMVKLFEHLGQDQKLGLRGRPLRPLGPLNTSKIFRICGNTVVLYPLIFELKDFYTNADSSTLIEDIKGDLEFIARRWKLTGRPTFCMILREENVAGEYFANMLDLLVKLKNGFVNGVRVRLGRIHQLINTGCIEHIDMVDPDDVEFDVDPLEEIDANEAQFRSRTNLRNIPPENADGLAEQEMSAKEDHELYQLIARNNTDNLRGIAFAIAIMQTRYPGTFVVQGETLGSRMERVYSQACQCRYWWLVRYCAAKLRKTVISLAPSVTNLLVRGKQVIIGQKSCKEVTVSSPSTPLELQNALFDSCHEPHAAVFQQELIIACSDLITQKTASFDGVLTIRLAWYTDAIDMLLNFAKEDYKNRREPSNGRDAAPMATTTHDLVEFFERVCPASVLRDLENGKEIVAFDLPPTIVKNLLSELMTKQDVWKLFSPLQMKKLNGALNRVPTNLYDRVWKILERVEQGMVISGHVLPQYPTLHVMTQHELNFSYKIESMMSDIANPEYRQLIVELFCIVATIMERNSEVYFVGALDCDLLLKQAFNMFCEERRIKDRVDMAPFYAIDDDPSAASTSSYLIRIVVDKLLKDTNTKHTIGLRNTEPKSPRAETVGPKQPNRKVPALKRWRPNSEPKGPVLCFDTCCVRCCKKFYFCSIRHSDFSALGRSALGYFLFYSVLGLYLHYSRRPNVPGAQRAAPKRPTLSLLRAMNWNPSFAKLPTAATATETENDVSTECDNIRTIDATSNGAPYKKSLTVLKQLKQIYLTEESQNKRQNALQILHNASEILSHLFFLKNGASKHLLGQYVDKTLKALKQTTSLSHDQYVGPVIALENRKTQRMLCLVEAITELLVLDVATFGLNVDAYEKCGKMRREIANALMNVVYQQREAKSRLCSNIAFLRRVSDIIANVPYLDQYYAGLVQNVSYNADKKSDLSFGPQLAITVPPLVRVVTLIMGDGQRNASMNLEHSQKQRLYKLFSALWNLAESPIENKRVMCHDFPSFVPLLLRIMVVDPREVPLIQAAIGIFKHLCTFIIQYPELFSKTLGSGVVRALLHQIYSSSSDLIIDALAALSILCRHPYAAHELLCHKSCLQNIQFLTKNTNEGIVRAARTLIDMINSVYYQAVALQNGMFSSVVGWNCALTSVEANHFGQHRHQIPGGGGDFAVHYNTLPRAAQQNFFKAQKEHNTAKSPMEMPKGVLRQQNCHLNSEQNVQQSGRAQNGQMADENREELRLSSNEADVGETPEESAFVTEPLIEAGQDLSTSVQCTRDGSPQSSFHSRSVDGVANGEEWPSVRSTSFNSRRSSGADSPASPSDLPDSPSQCVGHKPFQLEAMALLIKKALEEDEDEGKNGKIGPRVVGESRPIVFDENGQSVVEAIEHRKKIKNAQANDDNNSENTNSGDTLAENASTNSVNDAFLDDVIRNYMPKPTTQCHASSIQIARPEQRSGAKGQIQNWGNNDTREFVGFNESKSQASIDRTEQKHCDLVDGYAKGGFSQKVFTELPADVDAEFGAQWMVVDCGAASSPKMGEDHPERSRFSLKKTHSQSSIPRPSAAATHLDRPTTTRSSMRTQKAPPLAPKPNIFKLAKSDRPPSMVFPPFACHSLPPNPDQTGQHPINQID